MTTSIKKHDVQHLETSTQMRATVNEWSLLCRALRGHFNCLSGTEKVREGTRRYKKVQEV
jgi:hypothetical protein